MSRRTLYRLSALAGVLSGLCIIVGKLLIALPNRQIGEIVDFCSPLFALPFAVGLYLSQRREAGVFGGIAFMTMFMGVAGVLSLDYIGAFVAPYLDEGVVDQMWESPTGVVAAASGSVFLIGEILFGISVVRAKVFSTTASMLFMVGMFPVPLGQILPESAVVSGSIMAGSGLMWWGIELYERANKGVDPE